MKKLLFLFGIITTIISCNKDDMMGPGGLGGPGYPCADCLLLENNIACPSHQQYGNDSLVLKFNFCDKDGDIGLGINDTTGIFAQGNIYMIYYYKDSIGNWSLYDTDNITPQMDTLILKYRIPPVPVLPITTPVIIGGSQNPVKVILQSSDILTGEIQCMVKPFVVPHSEIKFEIFMYDKALNKSNTITTASIYP